MRRSSWLWCWLVAALLASPPLAAETAEARAEALFQQGRDLLEQDRFEEACSKLEQSYDLDPATGTLLGLALCHERVGKPASAFRAYSEVLRRAHAEGRTDRAEVAQKRLELLMPAISIATIEFSRELATIPGIELIVDGKALALEENPISVPLDLGEHTIEARAPGRTPWTRVLHVATASERPHVSIPPLPLLQPAAAGTQAAPSSRAARLPARVAPSRFRTVAVEEPAGRAPWTVIALTASGAALLSSATFGVLAWLRHDALNCPRNECPRNKSSEVDRYNDLRTASTVSLGTGIVALATGLVLHITTGERRTEPRVPVSPALGSRFVGVKGHF